MTSEGERVRRILADLRRVGALGPLQDMLRGHKLRSTKTWSKVDERIAGHLRREELTFADVSDLYERVRIYSGKSHFFYRIPTSTRDALLEGAGVPANEFSAEYPAPLSDTELHRRALKARPPVLTKVNLDEEGAAYVFCNARAEMEREQLDSDEVAKEVRERYPGAKFFAERAVNYQSFDCARASTSDRVLHVSIDSVGRATGAHLSALHKAMQRQLGVPPSTFAKPIDLFPAVESIYDDAKEGRVCELHFDVPTQAVFRQTFRRSKKDLRNEDFHVAGKKAVTEITPYRLSVQWKRPSGQVEATLPGSQRMLAALGGLYHCIVPGFCDPDDIEFALRRVRLHAKP